MNLSLYETIPEDAYSVKINPRAQKDYLYPLHWHEHTEIQFIFSGEAMLLTEKGREVIKPHTAIVINPGELHGGEHSVVSYGCVILPPEMTKNPSIRYRRIIKDGYIGELFDRMYSAFEKKSRGSYHEITGICHLLMAHLTDFYVIDEGKNARTNIIKTATEIIKDRLTDEISLSQIAEALHVSPAYLSRLFSKEMGVSFSKYIINQRLLKAVSLLCTTEMNITEIALFSGFSDANYFTRIFHREYGVSPREYRKRRYK